MDSVIYLLGANLAVMIVTALIQVVMYVMLFRKIFYMCCKKCIEKRAQRKRERKAEVPQIEMTGEEAPYDNVKDQSMDRGGKATPRKIDMSGEFDDEDLNDRAEKI